jgi:ACS family tartrate transporter-like MFS transporter
MYHRSTGKAGMDKVFAKAAKRLIPFMILLYVVSFLDRVNVSFAALTMNKDLNFSPEIYGAGAGIFFLGYFLFEVPSNVIMERVGARLWMCRIMLTWGIVSMATAFVRGPYEFYAARFLLGLAEAGFFPGMVLYLTYWFPSETRARFIALFLAGVPLASVIGAPVSGYLLGFENLAGLHGWQWLFLIEGAPSCVLAFVILFVLPDRPSKASWLSAAEKNEIETRLAAEPKRDHEALIPMLRDARVWLLAIPDFGIVIALYGVGLWLPQIVKGMGYTNIETGFVVAIPYLASVIGMVAVGASSDRSGERILHIAIPALMAAGGLVAAAILGESVAAIVALTVALVGIYAALSVFWTLPPSFLGGTAAAGGIALINSISNLGGFFGPNLMGWLKQTTGGYSAGMLVLAAGLVAAAGLAAAIGTRALAPAHAAR